MAKMTRRKGRKLEGTGALAGRRHGFISEIKMDVEDIGTITVKTTSKTLVAAKAVFKDASCCFHQKMRTHPLCKTKTFFQKNIFNTPVVKCCFPLDSRVLACTTLTSGPRAFLFS